MAAPGSDTLTGGNGDDRFIFSVDDEVTVSTKKDTITDFTQGEDVIDLSGFGYTSFSELDLRSDSSGVKLIASSNHYVIIEGLTVADMTASDFVFTDSLIVTIPTTTSTDTVMGSTDDLMRVTSETTGAVYGGDGDDRLLYGNGDQALYGEGGDDTLSGAGGDDYLDGGEGNDIYYGGRGADTFVFQDLVAHANDVDVIADFGEGADVIRLEGVTPTDLDGLGLVQNGSDTEFVLSNGQTIVLQDVDSSTLSISDFEFA